jgi:hypothetical protein
MQPAECHGEGGRGVDGVDGGVLDGGGVFCVAPELAGMTAALPILLLGAVNFIAQDLPNLAVEVVAGEPGFTYRLADLDGNGQQDLILPSGVYFQLNGAFSEQTKAPNPATDPAACDVWNGTLYLRLPDKLREVRWEGDAWSIKFEQEIKWPDPGNQMMLSAHAPSALRFERFLHDIDRDGTPEIVVPTERGLCIMRAGIGGYCQSTGELDVFPPLQLAHVEDRQLWPENARGIAFPARLMNCRYNLNGNEIAVITREDLAGSLVRYQTKRFFIDTASLAILPEQTRQEVTEPVPAYVQFMRLNDDGVLDIGGGDWQVAQSSPMPIPIFETRASTDAGKTFTKVRVAGFRPHQPFIDVNHDGRTDLVTEATGLFDGGLRESLNRFCTARQFTHQVDVHLQDASNQFSPSADVSGVFTIELDTAPMRGGVMFNRYQSGELIDLTGDFTGDGWNDALVQDRPDRLALYRGGPNGFDRQPCGTLPLQGVQRFSVADYNGDGRADVAVHWYEAEEAEAQLKTRIYLTREGSD